VRVDAEQAQLEDLEQATGAGADDDDVGLDGAVHGAARETLGQECSPADGKRGILKLQDACAYFHDSQLFGSQARVVARDLEIVPVAARGPAENGLYSAATVSA